MGDAGRAARRAPASRPAPRWSRPPWPRGAERHALRARLPRRHHHAGAAHREGEHAHPRAFEKNAPLHGVHSVLSFAVIRRDAGAPVRWCRSGASERQRGGGIKRAGRGDFTMLYMLERDPMTEILDRAIAISANAFRRRSGCARSGPALAGRGMAKPYSTTSTNETLCGHSRGARPGQAWRIRAGAGHSSSVEALHQKAGRRSAYCVCSVRRSRKPAGGVPSSGRQTASQVARETR